MKPPTPWPRDPLPRAALPDVTPFGYTGNRLHPTQQPVAAMRTVLEAYTQPSQLVLDPFCGSGSTLEPPRASGRDWRGCELDPRFAAVARGRLAA